MNHLPLRCRIGMLGTLVNTAAVLVGSCIGLLFRKGLPERFGQVIMKGLGLCVMYIGVKGALKGENEIIAILSIAVGAVIGELLRLDERLEKLGGWIERKCKKREDDKTSVTEGFVSASLLFCVGAMTILGSLESGISGDHSTVISQIHSGFHLLYYIRFHTRLRGDLLCGYCTCDTGFDYSARGLDRTCFD